MSTTMPRVWQVGDTIRGASHHLERLARGGAPLVPRPLQDLLPRPRRRRGVPLWRVLEVVGRVSRHLLTALAIAAVAAVVVIGSMGHGMGWL